MDKKTLESVVGQMVELGWNPRIEFAMHGEPSLHPDFVGMVRLARSLAPRFHVMMTSNGGGLLRKPGAAKSVAALFEAGLNVLALDDYVGVGIVPKIREAVRDGLPGVMMHEYPDDPRGNPHQRRRPHERVLSFVKAIDEADKGTHATLNNHAGAGAPLSDAGQGKRCAKPFRELSVRWDGSVAVCCNDWRGVYKCGNAAIDGLDAVWNGDAMNAARQKLVIGQRDFGPCAGCDAISYRVGLLPDKLGKKTMPKPNAATEKAIAAALAGPSYTKAVLRPWEKQK
jgi:MoaA/NifB/PqqE/SkfB family radical SAM enzyme